MPRATILKYVFAAAILLLGMGILSYPHIVQFINNEHASRLVEEFNNDISLPASDEAGEVTEAITEETAARAQEGGDDIFASISIPKLGLDLPIYIGSSSKNLSRGIAHLENTSLPSGGESTHAVLAGHNGALANEWFTRIDEMEIDDTFFIQKGESVLNYKVISVKIIAPTETSELLIQRGRDLVTLLTCTDDGSRRLIVTGERVVE